MTTYTDPDSNFGANGPFFRIIRQGLTGIVDGDDYFDLLADDVEFDYVIATPGYPRHVVGRNTIIDLYAGYDDYMSVTSADSLGVYRDAAQSVVVLEYAVHGRSLSTGQPYDNHFVSIITVGDEKITHWRDYLDPIAVFDATGWPSQRR
jgi:ketosteroid isomerase-like protein